MDDVALVLDFLNTVDVEDGTDVLREPGAWHEWARQRSLRPGERDKAGEIRDALRAAVADAGPGRPVRARVHVVLADGAPALVSEDATGAVMAAAARLAVCGEWDRVKICPADDCRWAFYDRSRNHSRAWCSMRVCGNRQKARAWRARTRADA